MERFNIVRAGVSALMLVLAGCGGGGGSSKASTNNPPPAQNIAPAANAGPGQTVDEQTLVSLAGSGTDSDGTITGFTWTQTAGSSVTLSSSAVANPTFTAPSISVAETLTFLLIVTDDVGATGSDTVDIDVNPIAGLNDSPVANAGSDSTVMELTNVSLNGNMSSDPDGVISMFGWAQTAGPAVTINNNTSAVADFAAPDVSAPTDFTFELTVTDNEGAVDIDTVVITVVETVATITISGTVSYDGIPHNPGGIGLEYGKTAAQPVRGALIQAIDGTNGISVLASTSSDANGDYQLAVMPNTVVKIRARAQMRRTGMPFWDFRVVDNTNSKALYVLDSAVFNSGNADQSRDLHAASGWGGASYTGTRAAGPFSILDALYQAYTLVLSVDANALFAPLDINWSVNNVPSSPFNPATGQIITSFFDGTEIFLLGAENVDTDEYDQHVIIHEWGHYFESVFSRSDSIGGAHASGDRLDMRVAFGEGWGNAFSGMAKGDALYADSLGNQQSNGFTINVEANNGPSPGWYSENSVQSILYDIFDTDNDGNDVFSLGFGPLYDVFTGAYATDVPLTSIFSYITDLKVRNPGSAGLIDTLVNGQNIVAAGMDEWASTETNNAGNALDVLPVYSDIVVDGASVNVCSISSFQTYNGTSVRRFIRFDVGVADNYTITAGGPVGSDPDIVLHQGGVLMISQSAIPAIESFDFMLTPGTYVLEVYEFTNLTDTPLGKTCMDVSVAESLTIQSIP